MGRGTAERCGRRPTRRRGSSVPRGPDVWKIRSGPARLRRVRAARLRAHRLGRSAGGYVRSRSKSNLAACYATLYRPLDIRRPTLLTKPRQLPTMADALPEGWAPVESSRCAPKQSAPKVEHRSRTWCTWCTNESLSQPRPSLSGARQPTSVQSEAAPGQPGQPPARRPAWRGIYTRPRGWVLVAALSRPHRSAVALPGRRLAPVNSLTSFCLTVAVPPQQRRYLLQERGDRRDDVGPPHGAYDRGRAACWVGASEVPQHRRRVLHQQRCEPSQSANAPSRCASSLRLSRNSVLIRACARANSDG